MSNIGKRDRGMNDAPEADPNIWRVKGKEVVDTSCCCLIRVGERFAIQIQPVRLFCAESMVENC